MASRKRGRAVPGIEYPTQKRTARGASPDPLSCVGRKSSMPNTIDKEQYSNPTIPQPHHFSTNAYSSNLALLQSHGGLEGYGPPAGGHFSGPDDQDFHDFSSTQQTSHSSSSKPSSSHISSVYGPNSWYVDGASRASMDEMCYEHDYCTAQDCPSCDSSCYEPCLNPEECSSATCRNMSCYGSPLPSCADHHITPVAKLLGDPEDDRLQCGWLGNGVNCQQSEPTKNELGAHVTESHIKPQSQVTCEWDSCGIETDVRQLPNHLWTDHEPASYVCLWSNCVQKFKTHEELDQHFKQVHCNIGCHWAGCEMVTMSQVELQNHFNTEHLKLDDFRSSEDCAMSISPQTSMQDVHQHTANNYNLKGCAQISSQKSTSSSETSSEIESDMLKSKMCKWVCAEEETGVCRSVQSHGNSLLEHIKKTHNPPVNSKLLECGWEGCNYVESTGDRSKLWRHVAIHTRYAIASCRCCKKEFGDKHRLEEHLRKTNKENSLQCKTCGLTFSHQHALTIHIRTHTGEKPIKCEECDYTCSDPSNMSKHRKIHKPPMFVCETCKKPFCRKETLKRHMIVHDPNKVQIRRGRNSNVNTKESTS